jgi:glycosidase
MPAAHYDSIDCFDDVECLGAYREMIGEKGLSEAEALEKVNFGSRDNARHPMAWDGSEYSGFSEAEPWLCPHSRAEEVNVRADLASDRSVYRFYQKLLEIKKTDKTAIYGETIEYDPDNTKIIMYSRTYEGRRLLIAGNFSGKKTECIIPDDFALHELNIRLSNYSRHTIERVMELEPYEAILFEEN